ncbi:Hypothetical protein, putative [Bodo saltans]|uniref:DUF1868 domain-containing protein n=1 Tax=Bodo saltans TaxID=75058 RepID=A0A0S4KMD9_BODSA|nr:Hypothetical protein, putative [Bodo saltans]|eukprot:CUI15551.1 Hypothetical protein, putative [Bodo saltans]
MSTDQTSLASPPSLTPLETLELVRSEHASGRGKKVIPSGDGYAYGPIYGVTVVSMLSPSSIDSFAVPLFHALSQNAELHGKVLLLPPDSYHMTLRGLEDLMGDTSLERLKGLDEEYQQLFSSLPVEVPFVKPVLTDYDFGGAVVFLEPASQAFGNFLTAVQQATAQHLSAALHSQTYHVTAGYYLTQDPAMRLHVQRIVFETARRIAADSTNSELQLLTPRVCWYDSMKRFMPLF